MRARALSGDGQRPATTDRHVAPEAVRAGLPADAVWRARIAKRPDARRSRRTASRRLMVGLVAVCVAALTLPAAGPSAAAAATRLALDWHATHETRVVQETDGTAITGSWWQARSDTFPEDRVLSSEDSGTPTPTPAPARPFPAPVTTATYTVPGSIDATGATDVSNALNTWIGTVPDGSVVSFPSTGTYLLSKGIQLGNRRNLVFQGNGATLKVALSASGSDHVASPFVLGWSHALRHWTGGSHDIAIRNFTLVGNDPTPGTFGGGENQAAVQIVGTRNLEVSGVTVRAVWGDGFFVNNASSVWLHDNHVVTAGRDGVTVIKGSNVLIERNAFDTVGYVTFNNEPNEATEASSSLTFRDNTAGTWGMYFVSVDGGHRGAAIDGITVTGNTTTGKALAARLDNGGTARLRNIVFTDNTSTVRAAGPRLYFAHIDGLTVTGNSQPLISGQLASITDSTGVVYW